MILWVMIWCVFLFNVVWLSFCLFRVFIKGLIDFIKFLLDIIFCSLLLCIMIKWWNFVVVKSLCNDCKLLFMCMLIICVDIILVMFINIFC